MVNSGNITINDYIDNSVLVGNGAGAVNGLTAGLMRIFVEYLNSR